MAISNSKKTSTVKKKTSTPKKKTTSKSKAKPANDVIVEKTTVHKESSEEKSGNIIRQKLLALYLLQLVDTQIDKIRIVRGELPLEVRDLEDEIEGLSTRVDSLKNEVKEYEQELTDHKSSVLKSKEMIKKYESQQQNVRNNREYESLSKEVEYQTLEIQLSEKRTKEAKISVETKQVIIDEAVVQLDDKKENLSEKQNELAEIIEETKKEEKILISKSEKAMKLIEERLLYAYSRIRKNVRNGLAVVKVERDACGGCFSKIPPQRQLEIKLNKKIIVCEYCGRVLIDDEVAQESESNM